LFNRFLYNIGKISFLIIFKVFCGFQATGIDNIPKVGGFIVASNHHSNLDPIILGVGSPRIINFMAKEDLFRNRFFGWLLSQVGAFPIKRNSGDVGAIKEAIKRLRIGFGLVIFPQGTRKQRREIDVQPGIGLLASRGKVTVVPAFITGSGAALPVGAKWVRPTKISVVYGSPLNFGEEKTYPEIAHEVMLKINELEAKL